MIRTTLILLLSLFISTSVMAGGKCCKKEATRSCCSKKESSCSEKKSSCCEKKTSCGEKKSSCAETRKSCGNYGDDCSGSNRCNGAPSGHEICCSDLSLDNECEVDGRFCHKMHEVDQIPCWW